jgi:hypothetical protein
MQASESHIKMHLGPIHLTHLCGEKIVELVCGEKIVERYGDHFLIRLDQLCQEDRKDILAKRFSRISEVWKRIVKRSDKALIHGLPKIREPVQDSTETFIGNCSIRCMPLYGNNCHGKV